MNWPELTPSAPTRPPFTLPRSLFLNIQKTKASGFPALSRFLSFLHSLNVLLLVYSLPCPNTPPDSASASCATRYTRSPAPSRSAECAPSPAASGPQKTSASRPAVWLRPARFVPWRLGKPPTPRTSRVLYLFDELRRETLPPPPTRRSFPRSMSRSLAPDVECILTADL